MSRDEKICKIPMAAGITPRLPFSVSEPPRKLINPARNAPVVNENCPIPVMPSRIR
jgi:hypothetical protein